MSFLLEQRDVFEALALLDTSSIDLLITDPPYESLEKHRAVGTTTRLKGEWFNTISNDVLPELMREFYRVLKKNTHCYVFCDSETLFHIKPAGEAAGFKFWKPLVWDKLRMGMGYHYRAQYEFICFFEKGKRKLADLGVPDVLEAKKITGGYPTEKPTDVLEILVLQSSLPGELVFDPFLGSGSTGKAALLNNRNFYGVDEKEESIRLAFELLGGKT